MRAAGDWKADLVGAIIVPPLEDAGGRFRCVEQFLSAAFKHIQSKVDFQNADHVVTVTAFAKYAKSVELKLHEFKEHRPSMGLVELLKKCSGALSGDHAVPCEDLHKELDAVKATWREWYRTHVPAK